MIAATFQSFLDDLANFEPATVIAVSTAVMALALLWLALWIPIRIGRIRREVSRGVDRMTVAAESRRREATFEAVRRFESDPEVRGAVRRIWSKSAHGTDYALLGEDDRFSVITLLNYFDGVASGLRQGVLDERVTRDYLGQVIHKVVKALIRGQSGPTWNAGPSLVEPQGYEALLELQERWGMEEAESLYEMLR